MSREFRNWISYEAIAQSAGDGAAERDVDGQFPARAFGSLKQFRLLAHPPLGYSDAATLFRILAAVGRGNLSVGRIFEGHVNALFLIRLFGTAEQREHYDLIASGSGLFGVWNTDLPGEPVVLKEGVLHGKKNFASGVDGLSHALITASTPAGRMMVMVPIAELPVDRSWWRPLGMRASGSHVVDFSGVAIEPDWILGGCDDYIKEPWFSAGAIRFAAVHVGGMHAVLDTAVTHLRKTQRVSDPYQRHRLGQMAIEVEAGYAWLDRTAKLWAKAEQVPEALPAVAGASRLAIERAALSVLEIAERSVGAAGFLAPHPLERLIRDLRTYLRQPNPDGALSAVGAAVGDGRWSPGETGDGKDINA